MIQQLADRKDILNLKIKRRESFRPFAPSVLREHVADWFELDGDVPYMMQVYPIRAEKRPLIPAATHADGTGRLQTVTAADNGVPMVLNTSYGLRPTSSTTKTNRSSAPPPPSPRLLPEHPHGCVGAGRCAGAARLGLQFVRPDVAMESPLAAESGANP